MAGLLRRLFGRRDGSVPESPDIEDMLDWSPGPPPPPASFRVAPPPPPPPPPAPASDDLSTQVLWGAPPPPPEPSRTSPRVRLMLADGTVLHPSVAPQWEGRITYLARNLFPPGMRSRRSQGPKVRIFLADGTVIEEAGDELGERMQYLAENLLPSAWRS